MKEELYFYNFGIRLENDKVKKYISKNNYYSKWEKNDKVKPTSLAIANSIKNYELNMQYFKSLNHNDFDLNLKKFISDNKFKEVRDLSKYNKSKGIYILVLDKYNQIYIGQTTRNIRDRIVRHWRNELPLLKTPFIVSSILPIDCFCAYDTTKIYVYITNEQDEINELESKLIKQFPKKYLLNKTIGGKANNYKDVADRIFFKKIKREWENIHLNDDIK